MPDRTAAIAGVYEHPDRKVDGLSKLQIKAECAARALADAGLSWSDVDALYDASEAGPMASRPRTASGLRTAWARVVTAISASCSGVVPYSCMCRWATSA